MTGSIKAWDDTREEPLARLKGVLRVGGWHDRCLVEVYPGAIFAANTDFWNGKPIPGQTVEHRNRRVQAFEPKLNLPPRLGIQLQPHDGKAVVIAVYFTNRDALLDALSVGGFEIESTTHPLVSYGPPLGWKRRLWSPRWW